MYLQHRRGAAGQGSPATFVTARTQWDLLARWNQGADRPPAANRTNTLPCLRSFDPSQELAATSEGHPPRAGADPGRAPLHYEIHICESSPVFEATLIGRAIVSSADRQKALGINTSCLSSPLEQVVICYATPCR